MNPLGPSENRCPSVKSVVKKFSSKSRYNLLLKSLHQEDRKIPRTVRAENEDPFDIAGPTGTGNEGGKTGIVIAVLRVEKFKSRGKIRQKLIDRGDDHVMRRQHRQGPSTCAASGQKNRPGLSDQSVASSDAYRTSFQ